MHITLYSTSTCTMCLGLEKWLEGHGLKYEKKITDDDEAAMAEFMHLNEDMISVPFTVIIDDAGATTKISGFDRAGLQKALRLS